ncbi:hypothetical protein PFISCL1PPCAC_64 [Pristionchus fissidentatus]|uniref:Uncharacterized protein n=1 Tax=Pristionchus fissidentatus TaxID=1538716 RepID=A0AAV5UNZ4_9BILA|nr:hypothetical protein PFISCL1PPCAC_64 [Pristionchus fissidentatus]
MVRCVSALLALALTLDVVLGGASFEKKSDLGEFASALNGAGRLRYGKRSSGGSPYFDALRERMMERGFDEDPFMINFEKRAPSPADFVANLNKAERLRFGRK